MKCPNCGHTKSEVVDSRPTENSSIRRRRKCLGCGKRFTTYEIIDTIPIFIVKKDGSREIYDRNKMMAGMVKACYKRNNVTKEMLDSAADEIETEMQNSLRSDYTSTEIGEFVMEKLRKLDDVAYVRFASVYREFKDIESFMNELKDIIKANKKTNSKSQKKDK